MANRPKRINRPSPTRKTKAPNLQPHAGFTATKAYHQLAVPVSGAPSYVLSTDSRYADFSKWTQTSVDKFMTQVSAGDNSNSATKGLLARIEFEIVEAEKEEKEFGKVFLSIFGKGKAINENTAAEDAIKVLRTMYTTKQESMITVKVDEILEYRMGQYYSEALKEKGYVLPPIQGLDKIIKKYESYDKTKYADKKAKGELLKKDLAYMQSHMAELSKNSNSPVYREMLSIIEKDNSKNILKNMVSGDVSTFIQYKSGVLLEPMARFMFDAMLQEACNSDSLEKAMTSITEAVGSVKAANFIDVLATHLNSVGAGTNMGGNTGNTVDIIAKVNISDVYPEKETLDFKIDLKRSKKDTYTKHISSKNLKDLASGSYHEDGTAKSFIKSEAQTLYSIINMISNVISVKKGLDTKELAKLMTPFLVLAVSSDEVINGFFNSERDRANFIMVNNSLYLFSDLLKGFKKTYFRPKEAGSPIEKAVNGYQITGSKSLVDKILASTGQASGIQGGLLLSQKRKIITEMGGGKNPMQRLSALMNGQNNYTKVMFQTFQDATSSLGLSFMLTINLNKIRPMP